MKYKQMMFFREWNDKIILEDITDDDLNGICDQINGERLERSLN